MCLWLLLPVCGAVCMGAGGGRGGRGGEQPPNHLRPEPWVMRTENMVGRSSSSLEREWFQYCSPTQTSRGCFEGNLMPAGLWASRKDAACAVCRFHSCGRGRGSSSATRAHWKRENRLLAVPFTTRKPIGVDIRNPNDECVVHVHHPKPTVPLHFLLIAYVKGSGIS